MCRLWLENDLECPSDLGTPVLVTLALGSIFSIIENHKLMTVPRLLAR